jgi:hypothetical protein
MEPDDLAPAAGLSMQPELETEVSQGQSQLTPQQLQPTNIHPSIASAADRYGLDQDYLNRVVKIESGGNPNARTGSYKGALQLDNPEFRRWGRPGGNIYNFDDNLDAGARKMAAEIAQVEAKVGRPLDDTEKYLVHQQGVAGLPAHLANPDRPAWQNMCTTLEGQQKGQGWCKRAIWGNVPDQFKTRFGSVDNLSSGQFVQLWRDKFEGTNVASSMGIPKTQPTYDTPLSADEEKGYQGWKTKYAPNDSGADYDLRGAYIAGVTPDPKTGHFPDTFKKPNHPTFSDQSQYAREVDAAQLGGHWEDPSTGLPDPEGGKFVPHAPEQHPVQPIDVVKGLGQQLLPDYLKPYTPPDIGPSTPPGKVGPGEFTLGQQLGMGAVDLASNLAGAGIGPAAKSMFVGLGALKRAAPEAFERAMSAVYPMVEAAEKTGVKPSAEQLWQTGKLWMGPHGKGPAMAEIPDWAAGLGPGVYPSSYGGGLLSSPRPGSKLGEHLEHPQLYSAYPADPGYPTGLYRGQPPSPAGFGALSDIPLGHTTGPGAVGSYNPDLDLMRLASQAPHDMLSTLLHETQHAIAGREGFPQGTNYRRYLPEGFDEQHKAIIQSGLKLHEDLRAAGMDPYAAIDAVKSSRPDLHAATLSTLHGTGLRPRIQQLLSHAEWVNATEDAAKRKYFLHPGELIPKAVEMRMNLPPEELARQSPDETIREFVRALR